jgi:tRNA(Ile)-lysidine synthase
MAARLTELSRVRQANLVRWWLRRSRLGMPSEARLGAILDDLLPARADAQPVVTWPTGEVRRYRGWLYAMDPLGPACDGRWQLLPGHALDVPGVGTVELVPAIGAGISAARFQGPFELTLHHGGERLRPQGAAVEKSVTRLLREAGTEPWLRSRVPLIYSRGALIAVGDSWIAAGSAAGAAEPGHAVRWTRGARHNTGSPAPEV